MSVLKLPGLGWSLSFSMPFLWLSAGFRAYPLQWWHVSCYAWHPGKGNVKQRDDASRKAKPECLGYLQRETHQMHNVSPLPGESFFSETFSNKMQNAPQKGRKLPNPRTICTICKEDVGFPSWTCPIKLPLRSKPTTPRQARTHLPKQVSRDVDPTPLPWLIPKP